MIWQKEIECMEFGALKELQSERLRNLVQRVYENVPFYKAAFDQKGIVPSDVQSIDDISKLPFTKKTDLRDNYPFKLFAVPMSEILEIHASSGTTGNPTVVAYTRNDIKVWSEVMARTLMAAGAMRAGIQMGQTYVFDYYRDALRTIAAQGLPVYAASVTRPYREAAVRHFDPRRRTHIERLLQSSCRGIDRSVTEVAQE